MATRFALRGRARCTVARLLAALPLLAACDTADFSDVESLRVSSSDSEALGDGTFSQTRVFSLGEVGRAAIDYGLAAGSAGGTFRLVAQMQTSGDSDSAACEALSAETVEELTPAVEAIADQTTTEANLLAFDQAAEVVPPTATPDDEYRYLRFRPTGSGLVSINLFVSPATAEPRLMVESDTVLPSLIRAADANCVAAGGAIYRYEVEANKVHLLGWPAATLRADRPRLVLETACETNRSVPATCAGHVAPQAATEARLLAAGASTTGHLSTGLLGIGDRVVVALRCTPAEGSAACDGSARIVVRFEPVECKSSADCDPAQTCSSDGYCTGDTSCSTAAPPSRGWLAALAVGVLLLVRRRRLLLLVTSLLLPLGQAKAEVPRNTEVFAEAGAGGRLYLGEFYDLAGAGALLYERQGLQFGPWGGRVTLGGDYTLTDQPAPPFQPALQTLTIGIGAQRRLALAGEDFEAGLDLTRVGVLANPLVAFTGPASNFVGLSGEFRWLLLGTGRQYLAAGTSISGFFDRDGFRPSFALTVGVGFRTTP